MFLAFLLSFQSFVPGGLDARSNKFGEFVVSTHLYVLTLLLCTSLHGENAPSVNLVVDAFGFVLFLLLASLQFHAWGEVEQSRLHYRYHGLSH